LHSRLPLRGSFQNFVKSFLKLKKSRRQKTTTLCKQKKGTMTETTKGNHFSKEEKKMWTFSLPKMTLEERKRF
jgi:hypothetical protein